MKQINNNILTAIEASYQEIDSIARNYSNEYGLPVPYFSGNTETIEAKNEIIQELLRLLGTVARDAFEAGMDYEIHRFPTPNLEEYLKQFEV